MHQAGGALEAQVKGRVGEGLGAGGRMHSVVVIRRRASSQGGPKYQTLGSQDADAQGDPKPQTLGSLTCPR